MNDPGKRALLHSRYRPDLEASRYIEALNLCPGIDYFILIEPGLGYLITALRQRCPGSTVIALHADTVFRETQSSYPDVPMWFPDSGIGVQDFLEAAIPEAASVRIIEWRPSLRVYGDVCLGLVRESAEFIRRGEANRRTGAAFGRRWVRNFFRNVALVNQTLLYRTIDMPIVITGSGPSLESALPKIHAARDDVFVLAASSSLPALLAFGIMPDMVISTDGGGWALLHLYSCFRMGNGEWGVGTRDQLGTGEQGLGTRDRCSLSERFSNSLRTFGSSFLTSLPSPQSPVPSPQQPQSPVPSPYIAFALSAALPSQCAAVPLLPLNDGSLWQSMALHSIGLPSALVPQRGTVTASALELALILSNGDIFLAGMDLSVQDIRSHVRPYGFDHLFFGAASRLRPVYSRYFIRSSDMKAGGSYDVYAAWFKNRIASCPRRVFSLGGNHAAFEKNLPVASLGSAYKDAAHENAKCADRDYFKLVKANYSPAERRRRAGETLIAALDNPRYAAALTGELAPLLFPSHSGVPPIDVQPAEIAGVLRSINE